MRDNKTIRGLSKRSPMDGSWLCVNEEGQIDYGCFVMNSMAGKHNGLMHEPGKGAITDKYSVEIPMSDMGMSIPRGAVPIPPGSGGISDGWSFEVPVSGGPDTVFSPGGGSSGGGGASGSW